MSTGDSGELMDDTSETKRDLCKPQPNRWKHGFEKNEKWTSRPSKPTCSSCRPGLLFFWPSWLGCSMLQEKPHAIPLFHAFIAMI